MMASTPQARMKSAVCQPKLLISQKSSGIMMNCPNEPAAAATPIAQERFSAATLRAITP